MPLPPVPAGAAANMAAAAALAQVVTTSMTMISAAVAAITPDPTAGVAINILNAINNPGLVDLGRFAQLVASSTVNAASVTAPLVTFGTGVGSAVTTIGVAPVSGALLEALVSANAWLIICKNTIDAVATSVGAAVAGFTAVANSSPNAAVFQAAFKTVGDVASPIFVSLLRIQPTVVAGSMDLQNAIANLMSAAATITSNGNTTIPTATVTALNTAASSMTAAAIEPVEYKALVQKLAFATTGISRAARSLPP